MSKTDTPERSWEGPDPGDSIGGPYVGVNDREVRLIIDQGKYTSIRCPLEEYFTEERPAGHVNTRDMVKGILTAEETMQVAEEVRSRLAKRPPQPTPPPEAPPPGTAQFKTRRWLKPLITAIGVLALVFLQIQEWNRGNRQDVFLMVFLAAVLLVWALRRRN